MNSVSIVISAYNVAEFVAETIEAALGQTCPACEVIVVDDGSTDATPEVLARYADRVRIIRQPNSGGPSRPRNVGIAAASGDLVAICDGDDVLEPDAVAMAAEVFASSPDIDLLWGDFAFVDAAGRPTGARWSQEYTSFREHLVAAVGDRCHRLPARAAFAALLRGIFLGTSSVVMRRSALDEIGGFDESLKNGDDRDLWLRFARSGRDFVYRDAVVYRYRVRGESVSRRGHRRIPAMITVLERQYPYLADEDLRSEVAARVHGYRLAYAHGLRRAGEFAESRRAFRAALRERRDWDGFRGLAMATLKIARGAPA